MPYKTVITKSAKHQLEMYISYTLYELRNPQAAKSIRDDATKTRARLSNIAGSLPICENPMLSE